MAACPETWRAAALREAAGAAALLPAAVGPAFLRFGRRCRRLLLVHVLAWTFGTLEVLITFYFLDTPVLLEHAIILESLGTTISIAAFFVPGSWGVQEDGYILIGHMLGLPTSLSLSLSFVKRVPDFVLCLPGLAAWHRIEAPSRGNEEPMMTG